MEGEAALPSAKRGFTMHQSILSSHVHSYEPMGLRRALPSSGAAADKYQIISSADILVN